MFQKLHEQAMAKISLHFIITNLKGDFFKSKKALALKQLITNKLKMESL